MARFWVAEGAIGVASVRSCEKLPPCLIEPVPATSKMDPRQSRFAGRACDPVGDPGWSSLFLEDCTLCEGTHAGAVREELRPMGRTHVGEACEELSPMRWTSCCSRGRV